MKKLLAKMTILAYVASTLFFYNMFDQGILQIGAGIGGEDSASKASDLAQDEEDEKSKTGVTTTDLGVMCISTVYPSMGFQMADSRDNEDSQPDDGGESSEPSTAETIVSTGEGTGGLEVTGENPQVLIIHTHATESYLPTSEGNFHSKSETNTVRDVGNTLAASLQKQGIAVVHDKTLHDYPSYNSSYSRSYVTTQQLLQKYPTVKCVIDLHRDAVSSEAAAATVSVNGKACAKYSYVIGTSASTYASNKAFVASLNQVAASKYGGFTGKVLERGYKYNQDLSSKYLLLEIGYNRNQIEESRNTAEVLGVVLAETLKQG